MTSENSAGSGNFGHADLNGIAWAIALIGTWFWTCKQLSLTWSAFPNYEFGYLVPWIAILLACRKIAADPGCLEPVSETRPLVHPVASAGLILAWVFFFLAELVRQFDPHWRIVSWTMTASVTLLTGIALWRRGRGKLLATMAFPLVFFWTAVPWPTALEALVTLKLRTLVTHATVSALHASGIDATQRGNLIDLASGTVEIDSACSGISSLQISIMASLFLGEFFRLNLWRRFVLLAGGSLVAILFNVIRAIALVLLAHRGGNALLAAWHDWIGYAESAAIFFALVLMAWAMTRRGGKRPGEPDAAEVSAGRVRFGFWSGREGYVALVAFALMPVVTWAWFALSPGGPIRNQEAPLWQLRKSPASAGWSVTPVQLSSIDLRTLGCSEEETVRLKGPGDASAQVFRFFWKTDATTRFDHNPNVCMVAAGWEREGDPVEARARVGNAEFPGKFYRFKRDGQAMLVFQCLWYGGTPLHSIDEFANVNGGPRFLRLALLWSEPRRRGLEVLNVYLPIAGDLHEQTRTTEEVLAQVLVPNPATGS